MVLGRDALPPPLPRPSPAAHRCSRAVTSAASAFMGSVLLGLQRCRTSMSSLGVWGGSEVKVGSGGPCTCQAPTPSAELPACPCQDLRLRKGTHQSQEKTGSGRRLVRPGPVPPARCQFCRPAQGKPGARPSELSVCVAMLDVGRDGTQDPGTPCSSRHWGSHEGWSEAEEWEDRWVGRGGHGNSRRDPSPWFMGRTRAPLS